MPLFNLIYFINFLPVKMWNSWKVKQFENYLSGRMKCDFLDFLKIEHFLYYFLQFIYGTGLIDLNCNKCGEKCIKEGIEFL